MTRGDARTRAVAAYRRAFGQPPELLVRAPGRVNLIGEHTDYNDGFVLPCAIDKDTVVAAGPSSDGMIHAVAADYADARDSFTAAGPFYPAETDWPNYVRGVARALADGGVAVGAAKLAIAGDVPLGSGLSSSASLEIAVGRALSELARQVPDPTTLARIAQRAENEFVGCACGIMDQLIATRGVADHALLIDCRTLECRPVALPPGVSVIIAHSGVRHAHAGGEYNDRRAQCEAASRHFGVPALRDLTLDQLEAGKAGLDPVSYRRARHVVTENARTRAAADALERGDLSTLGQLMAQSHLSMRDDFEITVPAVDALAAIMTAPLAGEGGARMTGGGFGGCVVAVAGNDRVDAVLAAIADDYRDPAGNKADVFVCRATQGAGLLTS